MDSIFAALIFFIVFFSIFFGMQWYLLRTGFRILSELYPPEKHRPIKRGILLAMLLLNLLFLLRIPSTGMGWYDQTLFQALVIYPGGIFFGAIVFGFIIVFPIRFLYKTAAILIHMGRFILTIPSHLKRLTQGTDKKPSNQPIKNHPNKSLISRRAFLKTTGLSLAAFPAGVTIISSIATSHDYQLIHKKLVFPHLPSGLNGFRIVQISDLHSGIYMTESQMRDIFQLANEQHPNLTIITGDFVDNSVAEIPALYRALDVLKADYGIHGCLGNHDHYASAKAVSEALIERGIGLLTNDSKTLQINGDALTLLGIDDAVTGETDKVKIQRAMKDIETEGFRVLMSHRPDVFDTALHEDIDLTLAGHTHGGQVGFDILGVPLYPIDLFQKYAKGLYEHGRQKLYVNVGVGMVGAPVRTVRPELTVLELTQSTT